MYMYLTVISGFIGNAFTTMALLVAQTLTLRPSVSGFLRHGV